MRVLLSGQIWKTEDVKMSVPSQAVMEEPSTEPLSPRGTCLEIWIPAVLLYTSPPARATAPHRASALGEVLPARGLCALLFISVKLCLPDRTERFTWAHDSRRYHWGECMVAFVTLEYDRHGSVPMWQRRETRTSAGCDTDR